MTINEAIKIIERWYAGGYATQIEDMNPAIKLGIEALKVVKEAKIVGHYGQLYPLPGETKN